MNVLKTLIFMPAKKNTMNHPSTDNVVLNLTCWLFTIVSLTSIQPMLTFIASIIAIASGVVSIYKKLKKK
jgi:hypothetical protein